MILKQGTRPDFSFASRIASASASASSERLATSETPAFARSFVQFRGDASVHRSVVRRERQNQACSMCSTAARIGANSLEMAIQDVGVHVAQRGMKKCFGKAPDDFKFEALPQTHGALVGAHHKIELHGAKTAFLGAFQRMRAHRARNPAPCCCEPS